MSDDKKYSINPKDCISCGICTENCLFLDKYHIDIGDMPDNEELAYNCFLCGKCTRVCPINIDGREIIYRIRKEQVRKNKKAVTKNYKLLIAEKNDYKFKNYKHSKKAVFFPGCNFPSFYPETNKKLIQTLKEVDDIGVVYDCCGKPIAELGMEKEEQTNLSKLNERFKNDGIEEIIVACPNCYHYLNGKINIEVVNIYDKLLKMGIGKKISRDINVFVPCPEREKRKWMEDIKYFINGDINYIHEIQCCGLGGLAIVKERELAKKMCEMTLEYPEIYTYCATCAGQFRRNGQENTHHILSEILEVSEKPDIKKSLLNRVKTKFY